MLPALFFLYALVLPGESPTIEKLCHVDHSFVGTSSIINVGRGRTAWLDDHIASRSLSLSDRKHSCFSRKAVYREGSECPLLLMATREAQRIASPLPARR